MLAAEPQTAPMSVAESQPRPTPATGGDRQPAAQDGSPKPKRRKVAGRKKGTLNVATGEFKEFCQKLIKDMTFRTMIARRFQAGTLDPSLMKLLIHYGAGRPPERVEVTGADGGPVRTLISFYIPSNGRAAARASMALPDGRSGQAMLPAASGNGSGDVVGLALAARSMAEEERREAEE